MFFRIKVVLQQMRHLNFTYIERETPGLKSSTFDQPCLETVPVLCRQKEKQQKAARAGQDRNANQMSARCPRKPNRKTQTYIISFQSQLYPRRGKKKNSHLRKQQ